MLLLSGSIYYYQQISISMLPEFHLYCEQYESDLFHWYAFLKKKTSDMSIYHMKIL